MSVNKDIVVLTEENLCTCEDGYFKYCDNCSVAVYGCHCGRQRIGKCVYCSGNPRPEQEKKWYRS